MQTMTTVVNGHRIHVARWRNDNCGCNEKPCDAAGGYDTEDNWVSGPQTFVVLTALMGDAANHNEPGPYQDEAMNAWLRLFGDDSPPMYDY